MFDFLLINLITHSSLFFTFLLCLIYKLTFLKIFVSYIFAFFLFNLFLSQSFPSSNQLIVSQLFQFFPMLQWKSIPEYRGGVILQYTVSLIFHVRLYFFTVHFRFKEILSKTNYKRFNVTQYLYNFKARNLSFGEEIECLLYSVYYCEFLRF